MKCRNIKHKDVIIEKSPFEFLNNLQGSKKYDTLEGLHQIKEYLNQFGYLNTLRGCFQLEILKNFIKFF